MTTRHVIIIVMGVLIVASLVIAVSMLPFGFGTTGGAIMDNTTRATIVTEEDLSLSLWIERNNETSKIDIDTIPYLNKEVQKLNVQLDRLIVTLEKVNGLLNNMQPKDLILNDTFKQS